MKSKDKKDNTAQSKAQSVAKAFVSESSFKSDPLGSYTGNPVYPHDEPEQDADDI